MSESKTTQQSLFEEFPPVSTEEWEAVIAKDLKNADYKGNLRWDTGEGIDPLPFYRREDREELERSDPILNVSSSDNSWNVCEAITAQDVQTANASALEALDRGADALQIKLRVRYTDGALGGDLEGTNIQSQKDFSTLLKEVPLESTRLYFDADVASPALLAMLWNETQDRDADPRKIQAFFSYDPHPFVLLRGRFHKDPDAIKNDIGQLARFSLDHFSTVRPLGIDARTYHKAGGTIVQELGIALAAASEYLGVLNETGVGIAGGAGLLNFNFMAGSNYFLEIAKFRAARLLWKNLLDAFGEDGARLPAYLHAETSAWNKTLYDPYTNMLRTTTEGMSAAIAGCDSLTVHAFDEHFRRPDDFSRRIARNSQIIMKEEANLDRVADPSAGSYYIEHLTDDIGREAWKVFQDIEREGGLFKAMELGTVQTALQKSQKKRDRAIARRGRIFVGTNQYPDPEHNIAADSGTDYRTVSLNKSEDDWDLEIHNLPGDLAGGLADGAWLRDLIPYLFDYGKHYIRTVSEYRGARAFEELRLATERSGHTPRVLTLPLGNPKKRKARSSFALNFFGCAGFEIEDPIGYEGVEEAVKDVEKKSPDIAVICSSDEEYRELVPSLCTALNQLPHPPILVLAGVSEEGQAGVASTYSKAGIDEFIHAESDVLQMLERFQHKLGIKNDDQ